MKTQVVHVSENYDVYIGRPSIWGNPFVIGVHGTRDECIQMHKDDLAKRPLMRKLIKERLKGKRLGCHCKPLPCHGDTLVEIADE